MNYEFENYIITRTLELQERIISFEDFKKTLRKTIMAYMDASAGQISDVKTKIVDEHNNDIHWLNTRIEQFQLEILNLQD